MMDFSLISQQIWFKNLAYEQRELLQQSLFLVEDMRQHHRQFFDYSFVIMPAAKAYEGFVKDVLFKLGLISEKHYLGTHFRVGKSLNPELEQMPYLKKEALYDELTRSFGEETVPRAMWDTWKACRNQTFHYFPKEEKTVSLDMARSRVEQIMEVLKWSSLTPPTKS